jgi:hypothetical protein
MKKQILNEEFIRMQKLAGVILNEEFIRMQKLAGIITESQYEDLTLRT